MKTRWQRRSKFEGAKELSGEVKLTKLDCSDCRGSRLDQAL